MSRKTLCAVVAALATGAAAAPAMGQRQGNALRAAPSAAPSPVIVKPSVRSAWGIKWTGRVGRPAVWIR